MKTLKYISTASLLFCILLLSPKVIMAEVTNIKLPDKFLGKFELDKSENFDEYLQSKGIGWILRKMIMMTSLTKEFKKSSSDSDTYDAFNYSIKKDTAYLSWKLGETIRAEGFDSKIHKITFTYDPETDTFYEKHVRADDPDDKGEVYGYKFEAGRLVMTLLPSSGLMPGDYCCAFNDGGLSLTNLFTVSSQILNVFIL
uniref:FABP domain-containing protein n=1 Tax=Syphacia muris TaxID=451379 RepID=A0A0N5AKV2_9BILA